MNFFRIYLYLSILRYCFHIQTEGLLLIILTLLSIQGIYTAPATYISHHSFSNAAAPSLCTAEPYRNLYKLWNALQDFIPITKVLVPKSLRARHVFQHLLSEERIEYTYQHVGGKCPHH